MSKILVKIIKREEEVEAMAHAKTQIAGAREQVAVGDQDKKELYLRREISEAISNWVLERNKNNRAEEIDAVRKFFDSELLFSEA